MAQHFPYGAARVIAGPDPDTDMRSVTVLADCWCGDRSCAWRIVDYVPELVQVEANV